MIGAFRNDVDNLASVAKESFLADAYSAWEAGPSSCAIPYALEPISECIGQLSYENYVSSDLHFVADDA